MAGVGRRPAGLALQIESQLPSEEQILGDHGSSRMGGAAHAVADRRGKAPESGEVVLTVHGNEAKPARSRMCKRTS